MFSSHVELGKLGCNEVPWHCDCKSIVGADCNSTLRLAAEALARPGLAVTVTTD